MLWTTALFMLAACASPVIRGTGDLGVIVERATGSVQIVDTSKLVAIAAVQGLGDLSHASLVYSRDGRYAYVFGRDGGLSKVDLLRGAIERRVMQAGNSIGGAISQDGKLVAAQNYAPGGVKVFSADTLELVADVPATYGAAGLRSKVVGLADAPGNRFVWSLFDADEIWVGDFSDPHKPHVKKFKDIGRAPYDGLITPNGRFYLAGLFGEDGMALVDLWHPERGARRVLSGYGKGQEKLPVFKMPHLRGWAVAGKYAYLPAIGRHEVLVLDMETWLEAGRIKVSGQPVFVMARPDGRQVWVNFAFPDNGNVDVIDVEKRTLMKQLAPGKAVLHMEFTPRGESVWISARDDNRVVVYDTENFAQRGVLPAESPSGIFFTSRAARIGF
ncbi:MAG: cytochrome D1 domain-containing protein [Polaromonas sp.]|uniref:cytochrome D1 domain-containing protein n=1 Tax=Polaromonas sp. TaxID=1869339 RepID=UPI0027315A4C|nr:cytochrome D1 domain-containing protein [Polaromonas sp.]MDP2255321.1 cytochrome D1 domain-containing protein [Polaromonas sp.]